MFGSSNLFVLFNFVFTWLLGHSNPLWLESLRSKYPLLSDSEFDFIVDVWKNVKGSGVVTKSSDKNILEIKFNVANMKSNFMQMVEQLKVSSSSREMFVKVYPEWRPARDFSINLLKETADTVDYHRGNSRIARLLGGALSLIGGGLSLASGGDADCLLIGSILMGTGLFTSVGTSVTEAVLLHENMAKAKRILKQDDENFEILLKWVKTASNLQKATDGIKSIDVSENLRNAATQLVEISKSNLKGKEKMEAVKKILVSFNFSPDVAEKVADTVGMLMSTIFILERYQPLFEIASQAGSYMSEMQLAMDIFRTAFVTMNSVGSGVKNAALTVAQKTMLSTGMVYEAVNLLFVALEDPKSMEGREIRSAAESLERQANVFKYLYDEMKFWKKLGIPPRFN